MSTEQLENATSKRIYWFDNAKFWLVTIVVIVHFLPGPTFSPKLSYANHYLQTIEIVLFLFVMQSFVFISGFFSKDELTAEYIQKSLMQLIVPYIIIATLAKLVAAQYTSGYLLDPPPVMWYLPALFFWRIILVVFKQFRWPILISLICAVAIGYEERVGYFLTLSRIVTFLPFFLLGHFYGKQLPKIQFKYQAAIGLVMFALTFILVWKYFTLDPTWLEMGDSYNALGAHGISGAFIRTSQIIIALVLSFSFFTLIPKKKTIFSELGTRSIFVYILHIIIVFIFLKAGVYNNPSLVTQTLLIPLALIISLILSSKLVEKVFQPLLFPEFAKKLFVSLNSKKELPKKNS